MKLRNSMLKILGFFWKEEEKKKKKHSSYGKKKKLEKKKKKKARTGFEPAIFGSIFASSNPVTIEMTPHHHQNPPKQRLEQTTDSLSS